MENPGIVEQRAEVTSRDKLLAPSQYEGTESATKRMRTMAR